MATGSDCSLLPAPPPRIGAFTVLEPISAQEDEATYLGEHTYLGNQVHIRIVPPGPRAHMAARRLLAEATAIQRVAHPGLPVLLDAGSDPEGSTYLVTEVVGGAALSTLLDRGVHLSLRQVIDIAGQLAAILTAAHARGVCHGALAPGAVRLVGDPAVPGGQRVVLLGLGAAAGAPADDVVAFGRLLLQLLGARADAPPWLEDLVRDVLRPATTPAMEEVNRQLAAGAARAESAWPAAADALPAAAFARHATAAAAAHATRRRGVDPMAVIVFAIVCASLVLLLLAAHKTL
ncbi:MAG TPA: hypothetical protein VKZ63_19745 [Kofleriaceae bacterium]|nr:hypothetical protein [Kofleriaceae bacterium]